MGSKFNYKCFKYIVDIVQILSVIIAIIAIYFSFKTLETSQEYNQLSVKPYFSIYEDIELNNNKKIEKYGIYLSNDGLGPGIIDEIVIDGKSYSKFDNLDWKELLSRKQIETKCFGRISTIYKGSSIPKDSKDIPIITLNKNIQNIPECFNVEASKIDNLFKNIKIIIKYHSFYNDEEYSAEYKPL